MTSLRKAEGASLLMADDDRCWRCGDVVVLVMSGPPPFPDGYPDCCFVAIYPSGFYRECKDRA